MTNLKVDDEITVDVKRLGINGEGIAYYLRKTIFIKGALPEEKIVIKILKDNGNYCEGEIIKYLKKSQFRVNPFCPHFNECGGCQTQHIDYEKSLEIKRDMLMETISKYSTLNPRTFQVNKTIGMDTSKHYRNKSQLVIHNVDGVLSQGLYKPNSRDIVTINNCAIQNEIINNVNSKVIKLLEAFGLDSANNGGVIKNIVTRISSIENKVQVTIIMAKESDNIVNVAKEIIKIPNVVSVYKSINKSDTYMFGNTTKLEGENSILEQIGDFKFNLYPSSFFQLNLVQTTKLYEQVKKLCKLSFKETVIDAYCGVGTISMYLAKNAKNVIGIEINEESIKNAIDNATLNKIKNIEFICGDVTNILPNLINEGTTADIMVFDPPRTGLSSEIKALINTVKPKRIVYVSCNPATLAKDLKDLKDNYKVKSITPYDMFPYTSHIESVTLLELS